MANRIFARLALAAATWVTISVQAAPVAFSAGSFTTSATAVGGASSDYQTGNGAVASAPIITSALAYDANSYASGNAIAVAGLLSTDAEVTSTTGFASATSASEFIGTFSGGGAFNFSLGYTSQDSTDQFSFSDSSLYFSLASNGVTLANQILPVGQPFNLTILLTPGSVNTIDLQLSSEATTLSGGSAQNVASLAFAVAAVPEPTTWLLMLGGLFVVVIWARKRSTPAHIALTGALA